MAEDFDVYPDELDFHVLNIPHGMNAFELDDLTHDQQKELINLRVRTIREDEKYLAQHPEVRAIVSLIMRHLFRLKPRRNIPVHVAKYVNSSTIKHEIKKYLSKRKGHKYENAPVDSSQFDKPQISEADIASNVVKRIIRELYKSAVDQVEYKRQHQKFLAEDAARCSMSIVKTRMERLMHPSLISILHETEMACTSQLNILSKKYERQLQENELFIRKIVKYTIDNCLDIVCGAEEVLEEMSEECSETYQQPEQSSYTSFDNY